MLKLIFILHNYTLLLKRKETNENRTLVSSVVVRHLIPCVTPRFTKKKVLTKGYIYNSINFESTFLENGRESDPIPLLKYSPGRVLNKTKKKTKNLLKSVIHNSRTPLVRGVYLSPNAKVSAILP